MRDTYISEEVAIVIKKIAKEFPDSIFCGSVGLVLNEKLHRDVQDIDVLVQKNYYSEGGFFDELRSTLHGADSEKFMVGKNEVLSFKLIFPVFDKKVKVDILYNPNSPYNYNTIDFDRFSRIKIETPEAAINAKLGYITNDKSQISIVKHLKDLIYLEVDKNKIIEAIDRSQLGGDPDNYKPAKSRKLPSPMGILEDNSDDLPY